MSYRESHLDRGKGQSYHSAFTDNPYRNMVWLFEKSILDGILKTFFVDTDIHHLDFACGTGRILSYLEDRTRSQIGVDLSPSMLEVARNNSRNAEIIEEDLTRNDVLGFRKFNLITAFRFFPNAETDLRTDAMRVLTKHLDEDGYLVFNNHRNRGSTLNRLTRLFGYPGYHGMSMGETRALLTENSLEIVERYHYCVIPASERRSLPPIALLRSVEGILSKWRSVQDLGENLIFVCRRSARLGEDG